MDGLNEISESNQDITTPFYDDNISIKSSKDDLEFDENLLAN